MSNGKIAACLMAYEQTVNPLLQQLAEANKNLNDGILACQIEYGKSVACEGKTGLALIECKITAQFKEGQCETAAKEKYQPIINSLLNQISEAVHVRLLCILRATDPI